MTSLWIQPKNAWWWLALFLTSVFPIVTFFLASFAYVALDLRAPFINTGIFVLFSLIGCWIISRSVYAPDYPLTNIGMAYLWGSTICVGLTLSLAWGIGNLTTLTGSDMWSASFGGAVPEELIKLFCVLVMFYLIRPLIWHPAQVMMLGLAVGFGFDITENILYGSSFALMNPNSDIEPMLTTLGLRLVVGPFSHMVWTGITAWGLGRLLLDKKITGIGWLFFAMAIHFFFNAQWPTELLLSGEGAAILSIGIMTILYLVSVFALVQIYRKAKPGFLAAQADREAKQEHQSSPEPTQPLQDVPLAPPGVQTTTL